MRVIALVISKILIAVSNIQSLIMPAVKSTSSAANKNLSKPVKTITKHTKPKVKVSSIVKQQVEEEVNNDTLSNEAMELKAKVQTLQEQCGGMSE